MSLKSVKYSHNQIFELNMLTLLISAIIPLSLVLVFRLINKPHKPPIFGVYQQKNKYYWLKYVFMYVVLSVRKWTTKAKRAYAVDVGKSDDGTIHIHEEDVVLENKFYFGDHPNGVDAVYYNGVSTEGTAVICGLARRPKQAVDAFMYIKLNGNEVYLTPSLPDTHLVQVGGEVGEYKIQGLQIDNFMPMRTWKLAYKGQMKSRNDSAKTVAVEADLVWSALWSPFNYDYQMSPHSLAKDIARENWSRDFFKMQKKFHQTHYEQMGLLRGTIKVDGKEQLVRMPCVRDHSFGKHREWRTYHRYVLHFIFLDNGDCMAVGSVSQPVMMSHITIGYVCRQSDHAAVVPVDGCDFQLYQHAENQGLPKDYAFSFRAGGEYFTASVQVEDEEAFYIGKERESKFYERWSSVVVNGVKGKACVEWQYNNVQASK